MLAMIYLRHEVTQVSPVRVQGTYIEDPILHPGSSYARHCPVWWGSAHYPIRLRDGELSGGPS